MPQVPAIDAQRLQRERDATLGGWLGQRTTERVCDVRVDLLNLPTCWEYLSDRII